MILRRIMYCRESCNKKPLKFIRVVLDFFLARTLDQLLAETGFLDFKFKFVPVAACRTRIDSDLHAFRAT